MLECLSLVGLPTFQHCGQGQEPTIERCFTQVGISLHRKQAGEACQGQNTLPYY
jgi:hypothetical protein